MKILWRCLAVWVILVVLAGCGGNAPATSTTLPTNLPTKAKAEHSTPMIIDTDMAVDDVMAILYLLMRPDVSVRAITVSGTGEAHCEAGVRHALGLVALASAGEIPVACGPEKPLKGEHAFPDSWRKHVDGSMGIRWPEVGKGSSLSAADLLKKTIVSEQEKVTIVTLGPETNLASALLSDPGLAQKIRMVYIMGGAVHVPGNLLMVPDAEQNQTAEFNIWVDPYAAGVVLKSGAPITLVPLDATNQVPVTADFYKKLEAKHKTPVATEIYHLFAGSGLSRGGSYFWDPLAAAVASDETLATIQTEKVTVVEEEGPESGRTKPDPAGVELRVATKADAARFEEVFLKTLNGE